MKTPRLLLACLFAAASAFAGEAEILLWPGGAPGSEGKTEAEKVVPAASGEGGSQLHRANPLRRDDAPLIARRTCRVGTREMGEAIAAAV